MKELRIEPYQDHDKWIRLNDDLIRYNNDDVDDDSIDVLHDIVDAYNHTICKGINPIFLTEVIRYLKYIEEWKLPETNLFYDDDRTRPMSYEAAYGSQGAKQYIRLMASNALKLLKND